MLFGQTVGGNLERTDRDFAVVCTLLETVFLLSVSLTYFFYIELLLHAALKNFS